MNAIARYLEELVHQFGSAWNRFWFTAIDPFGVCLLRVLIGFMAIWYLVSFTPDLITWFGPNGMLPVETVQQLTAEPEGDWNGRASYLYYINEPALLWAVHIAGICIAAAFTAGLASRVTVVLTLAVVLSYIHRAPMIIGQFEPVLTLTLFYLCFAPIGRQLSVDCWLKRRRSQELSVKGSNAEDLSLSAGVSRRLIQIHIAALYLIMGLTKLGGSDTWWAGEAMWWLIAQTESRLVDLTFLHNWDYTINLWTHVVVVFELLFGLLIWHRLARPLLIAVSVVHWIAIGLITGLLSFAVMMILINVAFISPAALRRFAERRELSPPVSRIQPETLAA